MSIMKKNRNSGSEIRKHIIDGHLQHYPIHILQMNRENSTLAMRESLNPVDVEDILSSRAIARTEIQNTNSPQRLRNIMEKDVEVVVLPKSNILQHGLSVDHEQSLSESSDFIASYSKDYLVVEHRFSHLSYAKLYSELPNRRMEIADSLHHQFFETDLLEIGNCKMKTFSDRNSSWIDVKRFSVISNDSFSSNLSKEDLSYESFHALTGDTIIESIINVPQKQSEIFTANRTSERRHPIITLSPLPDEASLILNRRRPPIPNHRESFHIHLKIISFSMNLTFEPIFACAALYDIQLRQKVSENFYFDFNSNELLDFLRNTPQSASSSSKCRDALFSVQSRNLDNLFLIFRMEKILQGGDISECLEPYMKDIKSKEKLHQSARENYHRLGAYRMPMGWIAVDLKSIIENAKGVFNSAESIIKVSAEDEFCSAGDFNPDGSIQDDSLSVLSVDRLSYATEATFCKGGTECGNNSSNLKTQLSLSSMEYDAKHEKSANCLFETLQMVQPVVVSINSFYKQEYDRLQDEELIEILTSKRKNGVMRSRLKSFPVQLQFELSTKTDSELKQSIAILSPEFSLMYSNEEKNAEDFSKMTDFVKNYEADDTVLRNVLTFPRQDTFFVNNFYRNLLYIYPKFANLSSKSGNYRNICLKVQIRNANSEPILAIYHKSGKLAAEYASTISYHSKTPQFLDEVKVQIPLDVNDGIHILFSFYHISCKVGKQTTDKSNENVETPIGYTWLRLFVDRGLQVGDFSLPISLDPLPPGICYLSPLVNVPNLKWLDGHKCLFNVSLKAVSTVHPLDNRLTTFFDTYNALKYPQHSAKERPVSTSYKLDERTVKKAIDGIIKSRPEPMVSFLYVILDKLIALISCPPFSGEITRSCFETMCQLVKVGTMLLDGGNVDELGRSQLFLSYIFYHKLTQNDVLHGPGSLCEQIEAAAAVAVAEKNLQKLQQSNCEHEDVVNLIKNYEKLSSERVVLNTVDPDTFNADERLNKRLLHEELMDQFANSNGTVRETACLYSWFFFELTLKAMAEYLSAQNRFFLPRKLRFRDDFLKSISVVVQIMTNEIAERFAKDFHQAKHLNDSMAFFLRDLLVLMDRTFVLKQVKYYNDEIIKKINSSFSDSIQALLLRLKFAFIRIICSHEHFMFLNLPFENMLQSSAFASSTAVFSSHNTNDLLNGLDDFTNKQFAKSNDCQSQSAKDLNDEYLKNHFLLGIVFSDLSALLKSLSNAAAISSHLNCFEDCICFIKMLLLCHENDVRLVMDTALKYRIASLYLPLVGIVVDAADSLFDPYKDGSDYLELNFTSNKSCDDNLQAPEMISTTTLNKNLTKELLISYCWVISNAGKTNLLHYLQTFSSAAMCRFVDVLQLCVSLFEYRPAYLDNISSTDESGGTAVSRPDGANLNNTNNTRGSWSDFLRVKSLSVLQNTDNPGNKMESMPPFDIKSRDPGHSQTLSYLNRKQSYGTQSVTTMSSNAYSSYSAGTDMANSLVDFSRNGSSLYNPAYECLDSGCTIDNRHHKVCERNKNRIGNIRWRSNEQLLMAAATPSKINSHKSAKEIEIICERQLSIETCLAALSTLETIVELVKMPEDGRFRFIRTNLIQMLTHMMSCNASVEALEKIFDVQRKIVVAFPELIFEQNADLCTEMCFQLLKHMASRLPVIRSQATGSLYLMMRDCYIRSNTFAKVKMQVTMSLSTLVSNSLSRDDGTSLSEHCLRRSLKTMLNYLENDTLKCLLVTESRDCENPVRLNFPSQVQNMIFNLHMILSDTVKMKLYSNDFEMLIDLMYRIAKGYQNNPDLRITWLISIANKHVERDNFMEAAHCMTHCAVLVAEYIAMLHYGSDGLLKLLPQSTDEFAEISTNVLEESAISDDVIKETNRQIFSPEKEDICESAHFSVDGFVNLIEKCLIFFEKAQAYELIPQLYKFITPIFEKARNYEHLNEIHQILAANLQKIEIAPEIYENIADAFPSPLSSSDKRCFGTYFRVGFYGSKFGDLNGEEFIYKEPSITKLSEISHRIEAFYAEKFGSRTFVEMIKDSSDVNQCQLKEDKVYIQITYVEPYFESWEKVRRPSHFDRNYGLNAFTYATPFTIGGKAHGSLSEQFKRRTILRTHHSFPYIKTRLRVTSREQSILTPIQVAIEDIEKKTRELASAIAIQPPDPKILQMVLQGCIGTTVNVGPIQIAKVFLEGSEGSPYSPVDERHDFSKYQNKLRLCFKDFSKKCYDALSINATIIDSERVDYQNELRKNYKDFTNQLKEILAKHKSVQQQTFNIAVDGENNLFSSHLQGPVTVV